MYKGTPKIAVFDSGVGGLSVLGEIKKVLPKAQYYYISDEKNHPYGSKSEMDVINFSNEALENFLKLTSVDLLVVACNTASTVALSSLRKRYAFPIVGVVPAIKPAALKSKSKAIGLLATEGTIKRAYTESLIEEFAPSCDVVKVGSQRLVQIAEDKLHGRKFDFEDIVEEVKPLLEKSNLDVVVLACTHFPLLKKEIAKALGRQIYLVDSGEAIANRVISLLDNKIFNKHLQVEGDLFFSTLNVREFTDLCFVKPKQFPS